MKGAPSFRGRFLPALAAVLAGAALLWAHLRLDIPADRIPDYGRPDALFYSMGAENLARGRGYRVFVNGRALPPKFPPGTSLILAPWYLLAGGDRASGTGAVQFLAFLLGLGVFLGASRRAGPLGGLAALLALEAGLCLAAFRNQMVSEVPASLLLLGVYLLATGERPGRGRVLLAGLLAGFGVWVRYPLAVLLPAPLLALEPWKKKGLSRALLFSAGAALPLLLLLAWQARTFGSPFRTGYSLWLPGYHQGGRPLFSAAYAFGAPAEGLPGEPNLLYYPSLLAGRQSLLLPWPQALAVAAGVLLFLGRAWKKGKSLPWKPALFTLFSVFAFLALYGFYFYQEARLLAPLAPVLALFGVRGARAAGEILPVPRIRAGRLLPALPLLVLLAGNGWFFLRLTASVPAGAVRFDRETRHAEDLKKRVPPGAALVTSRDILFLSHELPGRLLVPRSARQEWAEALLFLDWKRSIRPGGTFREFRAWEKEAARRPLPPRLAKEFTAPPAPMILPLLKREGRTIVFD